MSRFHMEVLVNSQIEYRFNKGALLVYPAASLSYSFSISLCPAELK